MIYEDDVFRSLVEAAPDAILGVRDDGTIVLVNAQTLELFGFRRDELIGQPIEILVPPSARHRHPALRDGYFAHPTTRPMGAEMELAGRRKDGTEFPAEISLSAIDTEHGLLVAAAVRDGTRRKEAAIVNSSRDSIMSMDVNGIVGSWNRGAEELYGYRAAEIVGRAVWDLVPPEALEQERALFAKVVAGEAVADYETTRVVADGTLVHIARTMAPITDAAGDVVGVSSFARDVSERKRVEQERRQLEDRLHQSERLESLGQLAGGVAHDFNNLLSVILNYASFVEEELGDNETVRADVEEIRLAAERAARLTHQLLLFGRRETAQPEVLDLDVVVTDVSNLLRRTLGEHVDLEIQPGEEPAVVTADRGQIEQVLVNLSVNARDAMVGGGELTIETSIVVLDDTSASLGVDAAPGRYVQLSVSDTGSGMSSSVIDHAFEPFFSTKPKGEGTGLGLATVYGIITEAGGAVTIYSEPGLGTTVRVYLPAADERVAERDEDVAPPTSSGVGQTVLLVEDEAAIRRVTARILERNGYVVLEAADGPAAIRLAADHRFDLLLTDVVMPRMSGRELADRLRVDRPDLTVLFMSGYSQGVLGSQRAPDEGIALVQKPFNERSLIEKLHSLRMVAGDLSEPGGSVGGDPEPPRLA